MCWESSDEAISSGGVSTVDAFLKEAVEEGGKLSYLQSLVLLAGKLSCVPASCLPRPERRPSQCPDSHGPQPRSGGAASVPTAATQTTPQQSRGLGRLQTPTVPLAAGVLSLSVFTGGGH